MTSKEALKELKENAQEICEWELIRLKIFEKDLEILETIKKLKIIEKDLEILEIIKKWSFIQENYKDGYGKFTQFLCNIHTIGMKEDFEKIKEWLEND